MIGVFCRQMVRLQSRKLRVRLLESKQRWLLRSLRTSASADRRRVTPPRPNANFQVTLLQKKTGEHRCGMGQYQGSYPAGDTASSPQPETVSPRIAIHSSPQLETVSPKVATHVFWRSLVDVPGLRRTFFADSARSAPGDGIPSRRLVPSWE